MDVTNGTTALRRKYDEEYANFNYIMVGAAIGLLLFVAIVAKILCICNKDTEVDQLRLLAERRAAVNRLENAPKELDRAHTRVVKKIETGSAATNSKSTNRDVVTRMPGEVSPARQQSGKLKSNAQLSWGRRPRPPSTVGTLWSASNRSLHLQEIWSNYETPAVAEEEVDTDLVSVTEDLSRSAEHATVISDHHHHHHHPTTIIISTVRPSLTIRKNMTSDNVCTESPLEQNVTDFLKSIQTMV